jgi:hypothetical protein
MYSRRNFIFDCSAVVAALAVAPVSSFSRPAITGGGFRSLDQMSYAVLAGQVNTIFRVRPSPGQVVELTLLKAPLGQPTRIQPGRRWPGVAECERFSLIFSGPKAVLLASAIHWFEQEQLGRFEMFISEIGPRGADRVHYEAGFHRPAPGASSLARPT